MSETSARDSLAAADDAAPMMKSDTTAAATAKLLLLMFMTFLPRGIRDGAAPRRRMRPARRPSLPLAASPSQATCQRSDRAARLPILFACAEVVARKAGS